MSCHLDFAARGPKQELQLSGCFYSFYYLFGDHQLYDLPGIEKEVIGHEK